MESSDIIAGEIYYRHEFDSAPIVCLTTELHSQRVTAPFGTDTVVKHTGAREAGLRIGPLFMSAHAAPVVSSREREQMLRELAPVINLVGIFEPKNKSASFTFHRESLDGHRVHLRIGVVNPADIDFDAAGMERLRAHQNLETETAARQKEENAQHAAELFGVLSAEEIAKLTVNRDGTITLAPADLTAMLRRDRA